MGILGEIYRSRYEKQFEYHPKKDEIVEALVNGTYESTSQVDQWFAEAEHYSWQKLREYKPPVDENGNVIFKKHND